MYPVARGGRVGSDVSCEQDRNRVWRLYGMVGGHRVDEQPLKVELGVKPPVPTLAIWSRRDGIVARACARGTEGQSDREVELDCGHMGFAVDGRAYPKIIDAIRSF